MSDVSVLTHEYHRDAAFAERLNSAVIVLQKAHLGLLDTEEANDVISESARMLATTIDALVRLLRSELPADLATDLAARVPASVVGRLRTERSGDLPYYLDDLRRVSERLRLQPQTLGDQDLAALNHLAEVTDAEASRVFRRLMRV
jgi:hypothetical protein